MISHYVLLENLGTGGSGVVYKARDTQLDRIVALKVLRHNIIGVEHRARFTLEAKLGSALNHPNIVTVYEFGETAGIQFIAMEWINGKSLADLIGHEGMTLQHALACAVQIADALAAAHAGGITHCDLKPANVMVTGGGDIKLLDFGLAKLLAPPTRQDTLELEQPPTMTADASIEGTPAYMSPEQSRGKKLDTRTDIFSFGTVFYEMVTGEPAFEANTLASTLARIRHDEPQALSSMVPTVPREIVWIIARCMRKDARRRFQHMQDIYATLLDVKQDYDAGRMMPPPVGALSPAAAGIGAARRNSWRLGTYVAAAAVVAVALAAWIWWRTMAGTPVTTPVLSRLTWDPGVTTDPTLSSDGRLLAYASDVSGERNLDIWVRHASGGKAIRLTHDSTDDYEPALFPDGSRIAFRSDRENGGIYVVPALGGAEVLIASLGRRPRVSPDGDWIAYWVRDPQTRWGKVFVIPSSGGTPRQMAQAFPDAHSPIWSPDSKSLLFCGTSQINHPSRDAHDWWVIDLASGQLTRTGAFEVIRGAGLPPVHAPGGWFGHRVVFAATSGDSRNLWQLTMSSKTARAKGAPLRLTFGTSVDSRPFVTAEGHLVFASGSSMTGLWSVPIHPASGAAIAPAQQVTQLGGVFNISPSLSLDGEKCVFVSDREGHDEIWLHDFRTDSETVLTASSPEERAARKDASNYTLQPSWPIMSPDGSQVAYRVLYPSQGPNKQSIYVVPSGGGESARLCDDCGGPTAWAADGRQILFEPGLLRTPINLLQLATGDEKTILAHPSYSLHQASFSPDDRWLAFYADLGQGRTRVYVAPYRDAQPTATSAWIPVSDDNSADSMPRWSADGNLLYFLASHSGSLSIRGRRLSTATKLPYGDVFVVYRFADARHPPSSRFVFAVSRDKIVFSLDQLASNLWMIKLPLRD